MTRIRLVHVTTVPETLWFLEGHVAYQRDRSWEVHAISSPGPELNAFADRTGAPVTAIRMTRRLSPLSDLIALARLIRSLRRLRPTIVHAHTPKAGLLAMLAAWLTRVPVRIYHLHGLPFETARGVKRAALRAAERVSCRLAHRVICVSRGVRNRAVTDGIAPPERMGVPGNGSIAGVDARGRFDPVQYRARRSSMRQALGVGPDELVVTYVGRLVHAKGIADLAAAWPAVRAAEPRARLLMVGRHEDQDSIPPAIRRALETDPSVILAGFHWDTALFYAASDVVVLPTLREGFPVVPLEAAAMGLPVVATAIPGCAEAVLQGRTGALVPPRNPEALGAAIVRYFGDPQLRAAHGNAGRIRALETFDPNAAARALWDEYEGLLALAARPHALRSVRKRALDVAVAGGGLLTVAPVLLLIALVIRLTTGAPVLFRQRRPGLHGRPFTLYKFRTMRDPRGVEDGDDRRLTRLGRVLRDTSLDELPELWNVLRGDMSLVGPRPLLMEYLPRYSVEQSRRHAVKPGMTGWAQVHGRNDAPWPERLTRDVWYVDHWRFVLDLHILLRTVGTVLRREGVRPAGRAAFEPFHGTAR